MFKNTSIKIYNLNKQLVIKKPSIYNQINNIKIWIKTHSPILILTLFSTSVLSLLQSALPLDLAKGSQYREALNETNSGIFIALQLFLLLAFQWPIGKWLSEKSTKFGLTLSLYFLSSGCLILSLSGILKNGLILIPSALILIALGLTSFLPTATEAIIKSSSLSIRGIALAIFSQCFGLSSLIAPITAGIFIDNLGSGIILWLTMSVLAVILIPLVERINTKII